MRNAHINHFVGNCDRSPLTCFCHSRVVSALNISCWDYSPLWPMIVIYSPRLLFHPSLRLLFIPIPLPFLFPISNIWKYALLREIEPPSLSQRYRCLPAGLRNKPLSRYQLIPAACLITVSRNPLSSMLTLWCLLTEVCTLNRLKS